MRANTLPDRRMYGQCRRSEKAEVSSPDDPALEKDVPPEKDVPHGMSAAPRDQDSE